MGGRVTALAVLPYLLEGTKKPGPTSEPGTRL